jgi:hypothetical protein
MRRAYPQVGSWRPPHRAAEPFAWIIRHGRHCRRRLPQSAVSIQPTTLRLMKAVRCIGELNKRIRDKLLKVLTLTADIPSDARQQTHAHCSLLKTRVIICNGLESILRRMFQDTRNNSFSKKCSSFQRYEIHGLLYARHGSEWHARARAQHAYTRIRAHAHMRRRAHPHTHTRTSAHKYIHKHTM